MLICVTGPECSGKTTLTQSLTHALGAVSVAEYAREYLSATDGRYTFEDLDVIAERQVDLVRDSGYGLRDRGCLDVDSDDFNLKNSVDGLGDCKDTKLNREDCHEEGIVITDTFILVFVIWSLHKYGKVSEKIKALYSGNQPDFYILCRPDLPWEQDPLRESSDEREALFESYLEHIRLSDIPFFIVEGLGPERLRKAIQRIESLIQNNLP